MTDLAVVRAFETLAKASIPRGLMVEEDAIFGAVADTFRLLMAADILEVYNGCRNDVRNV